MQTQPDVGHRLENAVALHLRQQTPANRRRELHGAAEGARLRRGRRALVLTLDQSDRIVEDGVAIDVVPAWRWMI